MENKHLYFLLTQKKHNIFMDNTASVVALYIRYKQMQLDTGWYLAKIHYIHYSPAKRGFVDEVKYWRYSSARDNEGTDDLI